MYNPQIAHTQTPFAMKINLKSFVEGKQNKIWNKQVKQKNKNL